MKISKLLNLKSLLIVICFLIASCDSFENQKIANAELDNRAKADAAFIQRLLKKQILLSNKAEFTNDRYLDGASGFLIKYEEGIFAVTARHLIGEAGGVEPEININDLSKSTVKWEMQPRIFNDAARETVRVSADGLNFSQSLSDIVLLKVISKDFDILPLVPNFDLPAAGETLFLIGCPYSETQCRQSSYPLKYIEYDKNKNLLVFQMDSMVNLQGFSGAPLVNGKGEAVGVLVSSGNSKGTHYVFATSIKEIQKIN